MMTMLQAFDLAIRIGADFPHLRVVAIGCFVPPEELDESTPWAVSVTCRDGVTFRWGDGVSVLRSPDPNEWPERVRPKPVPQPSTDAARTRPRPAEAKALLLFD